MIYLGGVAVGKTTMANKYENVIDVDGMDYMWIYEENNLTNEQRKGNNYIRKRNPDFKKNYCEAILREHLKGNIVLGGLYWELIEYLCDLGIDFYVVHLDKDMFDVAFKRMKDRGNTMEFIDKMYNETFIKHYNKVTAFKNQIILNNECNTLEDYLINNHNFVSVDKGKHKFFKKVNII